MVSATRFLIRFFRGEYAHPTGRWVIDPDTGKKVRSEKTRDQMLEDRGRATQARCEQGERFMTRRRNRHPDGKYGLYHKRESKETAMPKVRREDPDVKPSGGRGGRPRERRRKKTSSKSPSELPIEMSGALPEESPELSAGPTTEIISEEQPLHSSDHSQETRKKGSSGATNGLQHSHEVGDLSGRPERLQSEQPQESPHEQSQGTDGDSQLRPSPQSQVEQNPPPPEEENDIQRQQRDEGAQAQPAQQSDAEPNDGMRARPTPQSPVPSNQQSKVPPDHSVGAGFIRQGFPPTNPAAQAQSTQDVQLPMTDVLQVYRMQQDRPRQNPQDRSNRKVQVRSNRRQLEQMLGELREEWDQGLEERLNRHDQRLLDELQRLLGQLPVGLQTRPAMVRTASISVVSEGSMQSSFVVAGSGSGFLGGFRGQWRSVVQWFRGV